MTLAGRAFLHLTAGGAGLPAMSRIAEAQSYPTRLRIDARDLAITAPMRLATAPNRGNR
jgi:hypothetical protein